MASIKCHQCGLVSWIDSNTGTCKRCGGPLWKRNDYGEGFSYDRSPDQSLFSGVIKFLTILLGVAVFVLLVVRGFGLDGDTGKVVGVVLILVGVGFAMVMSIWQLVAIFGESVGWGLASLFLPFAGLVALIKFWDKTQRPFIAHLISVGIVLVGFLTGV